MDSTRKIISKPLNAEGKTLQNGALMFSKTGLDFATIAKLLLGEVALSVDCVSKKVPHDYRLPGTFIVDLSYVADVNELAMDEYDGWSTPTVAIKYYQVNSPDGGPTSIHECVKEQAQARITCWRFEADFPLRGLVKKIYLGTPLLNEANFAYNLAAVTFIQKNGSLSWESANIIPNAGPVIFAAPSVNVHNSQRPSTSSAPSNHGSAKTVATSQVRRRVVREEKPSTSSGATREGMQRDVLKMQLENQNRLAGLLDRFEGFLDRMERLSRNTVLVPRSVEEASYSEGDYGFWMDSAQEHSNPEISQANAEHSESLNSRTTLP